VKPEINIGFHERTAQAEVLHATVGTHKGIRMDLLILVVVLLVLFGGGGGLYWGMGMGWGIGPIGLIVAALAIAYLVFGYRGRRGSRL
jgi:hypothetical protein